MRALREFESILSALPQADLYTPLPCARQPLAGALERAGLEKLLPELAEYPQRAAAFCLLGDSAAALAIYTRQAQSGDGWAALQAHYLLTRAGELQAAQQVLQASSLTVEELSAYADALASIDPELERLPILVRMLQLSPQSEIAWQDWAAEAERINYTGDRAAALQAYLGGLEMQKQLGVNQGRSTFLLKAGRFYQYYAKPLDPHTALGYYAQALQADAFLAQTDKLSLYIYRAQAYRALRPAYSDQQVLAEYQQALRIEPKNYSVLLSMANVYLNDLKDLEQAKTSLDQLEALYPLKADTQYALGNYFTQRADLARAAAAYAQALRLKPGWPAAQQRLDAVRAELQKQAP